MLSTKSFFVRFLREHELKIDVVNCTNFTNIVTMAFYFAYRAQITRILSGWFMRAIRL